MVDEKCKPCEIYRRMCDVYEKVYFSQKIITNRPSMSLLQQWWVQKSMEWKHWLSGKEKLSAQRSVKKKKLLFFWNIKGPIIDFFGKRTTVNSVFYCQLRRQNSPYSLNDPRIKIDQRLEGQENVCEDRLLVEVHVVALFRSNDISILEYSSAPLTECWSLVILLHNFLTYSTSYLKTFERTF